MEMSKTRVKFEMLYAQIVIVRNHIHIMRSFASVAERKKNTVFYTIFFWFCLCVFFFKFATIIDYFDCYEE